MASRAFGVPIEEVTGELRRRVKAMSYGLAYGLSAYGLSQQLKISTEEAKEQMDAYFARFGGVRDYLHAVVEQARKDGYTSTVLGRRRYLPELDSSNRQVREAAERAALNAPIQGSAADIIKVAMIEVDKAIKEAGLRSRILLQVHDELLFEVAAGEREQLEALARDKMGGATRSTSRWRCPWATAAAGTLRRIEDHRPCLRRDAVAVAGRFPGRSRRAAHRASRRRRAGHPGQGPVRRAGRHRR